MGAKGYEYSSISGEAYKLGRLLYLEGNREERLEELKFRQIRVVVNCPGFKPAGLSVDMALLAAERSPVVELRVWTPRIGPLYRLMICL